jgi:hypothetical protein
MSEGFFNYYILKAPFQPTHNIPIYHDGWIPVARFAKAIGTTEEVLNDRFKNAFRDVVPGNMRMHNFLNFKTHARAILASFHWSAKDIEAAVKQLRKETGGELAPRAHPSAGHKKKAAVEEQQEQQESSSSSSSSSQEDKSNEEKEGAKSENSRKRRGREEDGTHEDAVVALLKVHVTRIEQLVKKAVRLVGQEGVSAATALPEFQEGVVKAIAEEKAAKRAIMERELVEERKVRWAEMEAQMEERQAELLAEMRADMQRNFDPQLASAVMNRHAQKAAANINLDRFFAPKK